MIEIAKKQSMVYSIRLFGIKKWIFLWEIFSVYEMTYQWIVLYMKCPVLSMKCPVLSMKCHVLSMNCPVLSMKCPVLSMKCPVLYMKCPVLYMKCPVLSMKCPVLSIKCPVLSMKCPVLSIKCLVLSIKCLVYEISFYEMTQHSGLTLIIAWFYWGGEGKPHPYSLHPAITYKHTLAATCSAVALS